MSTKSFKTSTWTIFETRAPVKIGVKTGETSVLTTEREIESATFAPARKL